MEFTEFTKMLMDSLADDTVKAAFRKIFSSDSIAEDISKYEKRIEELESAAAAAADEKTEMSLQLNKFKLDIADRERRIAELDKQVSAGESDVKASADKLESFEKQIAELNEKLEKSKTDIAERDSRISEMIAAQSAGDSSAKQSAEKIASLTAKVEELNTQLEKSKADIADRDARISEMTAAQSAGDSSAKAASDQIEALNKKVAEANNEINKYRQDVEKLEGDYSDLQDIITAVTAEKASADEKISQLTKELADRDSQISSLNDKISAAETEKADAKAAAEEAKASSVHSMDRIKELGDQLEQVRSSAADKDEKIAELETRCAEDAQTMESLRSVNENLSSTMKELNDAVSERDEKIDIQRKQLQAMLVLKEKINEYADTANAYAEEVENARAIVAERDNIIASLNDNIERLNQAVQTKIEQLNEREAYNGKLEDELNEYKATASEMNATIQKLKEEAEASVKSAEAYKSTFGDLTSMYDKYNNLSPKTKAGLDENQVFPEGITIRSFLSCGAQWGHIQALWEYAQTRINAEDFTDINVLNELFRYFLDFYNSSHKTPQYDIVDAKKGEEYNEEIHARIMTREERKAAFFGESKKTVVSGPVQEVVLVGYKNLKNGRIIQKSIVRV